MSRGVTALSTNRKDDPLSSGALVAANNGVSENPNGTVVFGQDPGAPGNPATLLGDRDIPTDGYRIRFVGSAINPFLPSFTLLQGQAFLRVDGNLPGSTVAGIAIEDGNPPLGPGAIEIGITGMPNTNTVGCVTDRLSYLKMDSISGQVWFSQSPFDNPPNFAALSCVAMSFATDRELKGGRPVLAASVLLYSIDRSIGELDRFLFTNGSTAFITYVLPQATIGMEYMFAVVSAGALTIQPDGTDIIRIDTLVGNPADPASSGAIGSVIKITCVTGGTWFATSIVGTWAF